MVYKEGACLFSWSLDSLYYIHCHEQFVLAACMLAFMFQGIIKTLHGLFLLQSEFKQLVK